MHSYNERLKYVGKHINAFVDLNGIPYLLAEYMDKHNIHQIDRSAIRSDIFIDQSESMRAVIDINIDDIGKRASDGKPSTIGNNRKLVNLLRMISSSKDRYLKVLKPGIIMRVNYQVENYRTHQVLRSMSEDLRINDRSYFLDINSRDIDNNSIITNFCSTLVSTINEFTHGTDKMVLRITNVQMLYELVKNTPKMPYIKQSLTNCSDEFVGHPCSDDYNDYNYHKQMQNRHIIGIPGCDCNDEIHHDHGWLLFNRFYHFDECGKDIILHNQEIHDPMTKIVTIPCGTVVVNRSFIINPGHRIIFKFSVWKNDVTFVYDASNIARALDPDSINDYNDFLHHNHHCNHDHNHHKYEKIELEIQKLKSENRRQDHMMREVFEAIGELKEMIKSFHNTEEDPDPILPDDCDCGCDHSDITTKLEELEDRIEDFNECECGDVLTSDEIVDMIEACKNKD